MDKVVEAQHGAPWIRNHTSMATILTELRDIKAPITPLQVLSCTTSKDFIDQYCSLTGFVGGSKHLNPFIPQNDSFESFLAGSLKLPRNPTLTEVEHVLRALSRAMLDPVRTVVLLLQLLPDAFILDGPRPILARLLETCPYFTLWESISEADIETPTPSANTLTVYGQFKAANDSFLSAIIRFIRSEAIDTPNSGIEKHRRWSNVSGYFDTRSREEIFEKERLLFIEMSTANPNLVDWNIRKEFLFSLLNDQKLMVPSSVRDIFFLQLSGSQNYEEWSVHLANVLQWCKQKKLKFTPTPTTTATQQRSSQSQQPRQYHQNSNISSDQTANYQPRFPSQPSPRPPMQAVPQHRPSGSTERRTPAPFTGVPLSRTRTLPPRKAENPTLFTVESVRPNDDMSEEQEEMGRRDGRAPQVSRKVPFGAPQSASAQCLRTNSSRTVATGDDLERTEDTRSDISDWPHVMPGVGVRVEVDSHCEIFNGLLDTASSLNFVSRRVLDQFPGKIEEFPSTVVISTMGGSVHPRRQKAVTLLVSIRDSHGEFSVQKSIECLVHEDICIPGGHDFLLNSDVIREEKLNINGNARGFTVSLPTQIGGQKEQCCQTAGSSEVCHVTFCVDHDEEYDDVEDFGNLTTTRAQFKEDAIKSGPLTSQELETIALECAPAPVSVTLKPGMEEPPIHSLGYPSNESKSAKLQEVLTRLQKEGIVKKVERGSGKFTSPGFPVAKPNGSVRLVVNFKDLNARVDIPPGAQKHSMETWWRRLPSWSRYYCVMDVRDAFYSLPLSPESKRYLHTSIWTVQGYVQYEWQRMPQGYTCSPSHWISHIEQCLKTINKFVSHHARYKSLQQDTLVLVYADDILVCGRREESTRILSDIVRQALSYSGLYIDPAKFQQTATEVQCMGLTLSSGTISLSQKNTSKLHDLQRPTSRAELSSALGLLNYCRKYLPDRLDLGESKIHALYSLRDSKSRFNWGPTHDEAWKLLVNDFRNGAIAMWSLEPGVEVTESTGLILTSDSSDYGVGYAGFVVPTAAMESGADLRALCQDGSARLILVGSRRLTQSERSYVNFDKEGLAIFTCLTKARDYIRILHRTVLLSDNKTAVARFTGRGEQEANLTSLTRGKRWLRWIGDLSDLLLDNRLHIRFINGIDNCLADYLSRYCSHDLGLKDMSTQTDKIVTSPDLDTTQKIVLSTTINQPVSTDSQNHPNGVMKGLSAWDQDSTSRYIKKVLLIDIVRYLETSAGRTPSITSSAIAQAAKRFKLEDGVLYYAYGQRYAIVVPNVQIQTEDGTQDLRYYWIRYYHESGPLASHRGTTQTLGTLKRFFWWPMQDSYVRRWVASCVPCLMLNSRPINDYSSQALEGPNSTLVVDWAGPFPLSKSGFTYVHVLTDTFTMYTLTIPYKDKSSKNVCESLLHWISLLRCPSYWMSDQDSTYVSEISRQLREHLGIRDIQSPAYSPATTGSVESRMKDIKRCFSKFFYDEEIDWVTLLKAITWGHNTSPRFNGISPFEVMLGRPPLDQLGAALHGNNSPLLHDAPTTNEYVRRLANHLTDIQTYWRERLTEARQRGIDLVNSTTPVPLLQPGEKCLRVVYISGRRKVLGVYDIVEHVPNTHMFKITDGNSTCLAHHYQLQRIEQLPERNQFKRKRSQSQSSQDNISSRLRQAALGTWLAVNHRHLNQIYIGKLVEPYVGGGYAFIQFWQPTEDPTILTRPPPLDETWTHYSHIEEIVDIVQVRQIDDDRVYIDTNQFGGSVVL